MDKSAAFTPTDKVTLSGQHGTGWIGEERRPPGASQALRASSFRRCSASVHESLAIGLNAGNSFKTLPIHRRRPTFTEWLLLWLRHVRITVPGENGNSQSMFLALFNNRASVRFCFPVHSSVIVKWQMKNMVWTVGVRVQ
jgi:hypothetical protein